MRFDMSELEQFRSEKELLDYFKERNITITQEEIQNLKQFRHGHDEKGLTMKQLDKISGGVLNYCFERKRTFFRTHLEFKSVVKNDSPFISVNVDGQIHPLNKDMLSQIFLGQFSEDSSRLPGCSVEDMTTIRTNLLDHYPLTPEQAEKFRTEFNETDLRPDAPELYSVTGSRCFGTGNDQVDIICGVTNKGNPFAIHPNYGLCEGRYCVNAAGVLISEINLGDKSLTTKINTIPENFEHEGQTFHRTNIHGTTLSKSENSQQHWCLSSDSKIHPVTLHDGFATYNESGQEIFIINNNHVKKLGEVYAPDRHNAILLGAYENEPTHLIQDRQIFSRFNHNGTIVFQSENGHQHLYVSPDNKVFPANIFDNYITYGNSPEHAGPTHLIQDGQIFSKIIHHGTTIFKSEDGHQHLYVTSNQQVCIARKGEIAIVYWLDKKNFRIAIEGVDGYIPSLVHMAGGRKASLLKRPGENFKFIISGSEVLHIDQSLPELGILGYKDTNGNYFILIRAKSAQNPAFNAYQAFIETDTASELSTVLYEFTPGKYVEFITDSEYSRTVPMKVKMGDKDVYMSYFIRKGDRTFISIGNNLYVARMKDDLMQFNMDGNQMAVMRCKGREGIIEITPLTITSSLLNSEHTSLLRGNNQAYFSIKLTINKTLKTCYFLVRLSSHNGNTKDFVILEGNENNDYYICRGRLGEIRMYTVEKGYESNTVPSTEYKIIDDPGHLVRVYEPEIINSCLNTPNTRLFSQGEYKYFAFKDKKYRIIKSNADHSMIKICDPLGKNTFHVTKDPSGKIHMYNVLEDKDKLESDIVDPESDTVLFNPDAAHDYV